jgi:hypothetical protein
VVHEDDLVIATFGRSFWVLDDVTPLRQIDAQVTAAEAWLFRPETTYRVRPGADQESPIPMDESLMANPPDGAVLDYFLKEKSAAPVQLEILDSEGKLVRRFASNDELRKTDPSKVQFPVKWVKEQQTISAEAGMHRFIWDLHYPLPSGVRTSFYGPSGPLAVPGNYIVKFTANGKSRTQPLAIKMDPRVKTPQEALVLQFELASKIAARLGEVSTAVQQANELRKQIEARKKEASGNAEVLQALTELEKKVEGTVEPDSDVEFMLLGLALPGKESEALPRIASALSRLLVIAESADVAPTADATTASEKWIESGRERLAGWGAVRKEDVANVNALLQKAKLKPLL